jgi:ABC-2 type transport system ATP-binding protein
MESSDATPAIEVKNLVKNYNSQTMALRSAGQFKSFVSVIRGSKKRTITALDGVNLSVPAGEVFGLIGPNGAGKTTLIKILSTLVLPDSGEALVNGVDVIKEPGRTVRMLQSVLAEGIGFERRLSGRQNLEFYATLYGIPRNEARVRIDELLDFCGLKEKGSEMFQKYSTGMSRRLLVCRALLSDASVLVFDEPTTGLDPTSAAEFRRLMRDVLTRERGKTILLTTHNLWEAQDVCDRIAVLQRGRIAAIGTPAEIRGVVADRVTLSIHLSGITSSSGSQLERKIPQVDGVLDFELTQSSVADNLMLKITGSREIDYNSLFNIFSGLVLKITTLESSQPSLEEAFMKLTAEEKL